ncbi:cadherin-like beta sandwich domain-containing protein [Fusibacter ferrireducens]|uniref:Cadherin-like beta sandwich domain-containing protein n=1 Tax=Fusibacter ferrireducens TaxID=2785058 RepID=A0ABR9ZXQ6_9FIRM|nr:cadherin-like beta sandwich domain-containing protein [Fusibacter ferrireducens]MBF4694741.1 cadherin-like beta sandwich domain-containing protein [Fusibacter ferrireducens]
MKCFRKKQILTTVLLMAMCFASVINPIAYASHTTTFETTLTTEHTFIRPVLPSDDRSLTYFTEDISSGERAFNYFVTKITPSVTDEYEILVQSASFNVNPNESDTMIFVYEGGFDPEKPLENILAGNDDGAPNLLSRISGVNFEAGTDYYIVMTTFDEGESGTAVFTVTGEGTVLVDDPQNPDITAPTVSMVSSTTANGTKKVGDVIDITVNFSEVVIVTGTPTLTLETGTTDQIVSYSSGSNTDTLIFKYTVKAGDTSADLDYKGTNALNLNGGIITDLAGNSATLTLAAPGEAGSLGNSKAIVIDAIGPTISSVEASPTEATTGDVTVTVTATDASGIAATGGYSFDGGTTWQDAKSKVYASNTTISAGTIQVKDSVGNIATYDTAIIINNIDKTAPTISSVVASPTETTGGDVTVTVTATDASGIAATGGYSFDGGTTWQDAKSKVYASNTTISAGTIQVKDSAGNITTYDTAIVINNIDKTAPTISSVVASPTETTGGDVTVTVTATDASGIATTGGYSFDGGTTWQDAKSKVYASNTTISAGTIQVKDSVGNIATYDTEIVINNIDKTAPVLSEGSASETSYDKTKLSFTSDKAGTYYYVVYNAKDDAPSANAIIAQGTAVAKGTSTAAVTVNTIMVNGLSETTDYKAYIVVKDAVGNVSNVTNIPFTTILTPSSDADIASVLSKTIISGKEPGTITEPKTASIYVDNAIDEVSLSDVLKSDSKASVVFYGTDKTFTNTAINVSLTANEATDVYIKVTAEFGNALYYKISINRAAFIDTTLSDIKLSTGTLSPDFAPETEHYTVSVANDVTTVQLNPIVNESHATVTAESGSVTSSFTVKVTSGSSIAVQDLEVGENTVHIKVTAQDGVSTKTYYVNIRRAASSEVALSNLAVDHGTLSPAFAPDTEHYTVNVSNTITAITLTPTVSESHSTIKVKRVTSEGSIPVAVTSGSSVIVNALEVGKTPVIITVTAQDEHTTKTYTIDINRAGSSDVTLSDLAVNVGTLTPAFTPEHESYSVKVPNSTTSITLTPITNESHASISVNGINRTSGSSIEITPLTEGENSVAIVVTAQDGQSTKTYNLTVIREAYVDNSKDDKPVSAPPIDEQGTATIVINGKEQSAGKEVKTVSDGKSTVTVTINNLVIESKIDEAIRDKTAQTDNTIQVPISDTESQVAKVELTGDIVKKLEQNTFDISVKRSNIEYVIPASELSISEIAERMGVQGQSLVDIKVEVKIAKVDEAVIAQYNEFVANNGSEMVFPPTEFEIVAKTTGDDGITKEVTIGKFSNYVGRVMEIPANMDPEKITTGIVFNSDGTYSHVPTEVFQKDGKWYTRLSSLTNSRYTVIYNPVTVKSVANHWSKAVVNDMASRLIVFNPETFEPEQAITRADFSEYLVRALGLYREGATHAIHYSDVTNANARALGIYIASENGIVSGYPDGTFKPNQQITREEAMVMYRNAMKLTNLTGDDSGRYSTFKDFTEVSGWASESVRDVLSAHIFNGTEPLMISPKSNLKYGEAVQAIRNLLVESNLISR